MRSVSNPLLRGRRCSGSVGLTLPDRPIPVQVPRGSALSAQTPQGRPSTTRRCGCRSSAFVEGATHVARRTYHLDQGNPFGHPSSESGSMDNQNGGQASTGIHLGWLRHGARWPLSCCLAEGDQADGIGRLGRNGLDHSRLCPAPPLGMAGKNRS
jgi:hypothetical protein